jgi:uncharacterized protein (DUF2141 family)
MFKTLTKDVPSNTRISERRLVMRFIGIVIFLLVFVAFVYGAESYTISGDATFQYDGDIYICLYNLQKYSEFQTRGHELSLSECKYIRMNADLKKAKQVSFKFESIPRGTYTVVGYQDENGNGKVDFEGPIIKEPWGTYKERDPVISPTWDQIKFELEENLSGIKIEI